MPRFRWALVTGAVVAGVLPGTASAGPGIAPAGSVPAQEANESVRNDPPPPHITDFSPLYKNPAFVRRQQAAADAQAASAPPSTPSKTPQSVVFGGLNAPGLMATDNAARNQGTPPDTTGAIGPTRYVEFVNSKVGVYDRANLSSRLSSADLDTFVGRNGDSVFDPQVQWDQQGQRWLYLADDIASNGGDFLAFGFSKSTDPTNLVSGWCRYRINTDMGRPAGTFFDDYPKLGHSNSQVIFASNVFQGSTFATGHIWRFNKPAAGTITTCPAPPSLTFFGSPTSPLRTADGNLTGTMEPANTAAASVNGYVVAADDPPASQVMVWHVSSAGALVQDGNVNVTSYAGPGTVPQPGTINRLEALDGRLTMATAVVDPAVPASEAIWTQHAVNGPGGRSVMRWYEIIPRQTAPRQTGTVSDPASWVFNGAISPAKNGSSAVAHYNVGSSAVKVRIGSQSRRASTPLSTLTAPITVFSGTQIDQDFSCTPCRWGDYSGATPDPNNATVVWGSNQFNGTPSLSNAAWATRNFALDAG